MCLAVPMRVNRIQGTMADVELDGVSRQVSLVLTPEAREGDYVLVHTGFAISVLDEQEAQETLALFAQMEEAARREEEDIRARQEGDQANTAAEEKPDWPTTGMAP
jgi:hydrogenase expression/formation protein HypC